MPAYRTHASIHLFLGLPLALAALKYTVSSTPMDMACFAGAFLYGTLFAGTLVRAAWLLGVFLVIATLLGWVFPVYFGVGGLAAANLFHFALDRLK